MMARQAAQSTVSFLLFLLFFTFLCLKQVDEKECLFKEMGEKPYSIL